MSVYIGIDWSATKHDVCILNHAGAVVATLVLPHTADGLIKLETLRQQLNEDFRSAFGFAQGKLCLPCSCAAGDPGRSVPYSSASAALALACCGRNQ